MRGPFCIIGCLWPNNLLNLVCQSGHIGSFCITGHLSLLKLVYKLTQDIFLRLYVVIVHWEQENVFPGVAEKVKVFNLFLTWQVWQPSVWRCYKGFGSASPTVQGVQDADYLSKEQFIFSDQSLWTNAFSSKPCWNLGFYCKWGLGISTNRAIKRYQKRPWIWIPAWC